jgi:hypothetical protein
MGERLVTGSAAPREDPLMAEIPILAHTGPVPGEKFRARHLPELLRRARARAPVPPELAEESVNGDGVGLTQKQAAQLVGLHERNWREFERGRVLHPKPEFVEHVARTLAMTAAERVALLRLAAFRPLPPGDLPASDVSGLQPMLDAMGPSPALLTDLAWNALAWNRALAKDVADPVELPQEARNSILWMFSGAAPERVVEVGGEYEMLVGRVRMAYLADGGRTGALHELVERLVQNAQAAVHWNAGVLALDPVYQPRVLTSPVHSPARVRTLSTRLPGQGLRLIVSVPDPEA